MGPKRGPSEKGDAGINLLVAATIGPALIAMLPQPWVIYGVIIWVAIAVAAVIMTWQADKEIERGGE